MTESNLINELADVVQSSRLRALIRYWLEKRAGRRMPSRAEVDPVEIPRLLPIALVADVRTEPARIRLVGSEATLLYGAEMRGRTIDAFDFGGFTKTWAETFALVARSGVPAAANGSYSLDVRSLAIEVVLLPLADKGTGTELILGGLHIKNLVPDCRPARRPIIYVLPLASWGTGTRDRRDIC
jgi:hypothetical protein